MYDVCVQRVHFLPFNPTDSHRSAHRKRLAEARFGALKAARRGLNPSHW